MFIGPLNITVLFNYIAIYSKCKDMPDVNVSCTFTEDED